MLFINRNYLFFCKFEQIIYNIELCIFNIDNLFGYMILNPQFLLKLKYISFYICNIFLIRRENHRITTKYKIKSLSANQSI